MGRRPARPILLRAFVRPHRVRKRILWCVTFGGLSLALVAGLTLIDVHHPHDQSVAALKADLHEMRKAIDDFYADKKRFPRDLQELVPHYLRAIPVDPITRSRDSWRQVIRAGGVVDVRSGA